jgi:tRNA pseudouridine55 synthase
VGQGTRVAEYLSESGKAYRATITFGVVTDTYDAEGTVLGTTDPAKLTRSEIEEALQHFVGFQMQVPPRYSAIKIQGQPSYKRVRSGEDVVLEPRPITISQLRILDWQLPHLTLAIECSKGTYIRSFAYDLGERLGYGAHLSALTRTRSGPFSLEESITLEHLAETVAQGRAQDYLFPVDKVLEHYPALQLDDVTADRVLHGNAFSYDLSTSAELARVYDSAGRFFAIATWDGEHGVWQPKKVFRINRAMPYC